MPIISESAALSQLREKLCAEGISNSQCPTKTSEAREARQAINEPRLPIGRPVHDIHNEKTTTRPTTTNKTKTRRPNYQDLLIEHEVEERMNSNPFADVPTNVLEAELRRRRRQGEDTGEVTEAELDALSAQIFDRPKAEKETGELVTETGDGEPTDDELDKLSAGIFRREEVSA